MALGPVTLDTAVETLLIKQITRERFAQAAYAALAAWADAQAFPGLKGWAEAAAAEEGAHAQRFLGYLSDRGTVVLEGLPAPAFEVKDYDGALETALTLEDGVTKALTRLASAALAASDFATLQLAQEFLGEQVEAQKEIADYRLKAARCAALDLLDAELFA